MNLINPLPVSESSLCHFVAFLAKKGLAPQSIKAYIAAVRHMQIISGMPEPWAPLSLPRLQLVLNGIARSRVSTGVTQKKPHLPITTTILQKIFRVLSSRPGADDIFMIWAACTLCFFGF